VFPSRDDGNDSQMAEEGYEWVIELAKYKKLHLPTLSRVMISAVSHPLLEKLKSRDWDYPDPVRQIFESNNIALEVKMPVPESEDRANRLYHDDRYSI
jgi:hypothetical protein